MENQAINDNGQIEAPHPDEEVGLVQDPLAPGEAQMEELLVSANSAVRLRAIQDFVDEGREYVVGNEWLFIGPGTYIRREEVNVEETIEAQDIRLRATRETRDSDNTLRSAGEEWFVEEGVAYLLAANIEVVSGETGTLNLVMGPVPGPVPGPGRQ